MTFVGVRKGYTGKVTSEQRLEEVREGAPETYQAEGRASAKALR